MSLIRPGRAILPLLGAVSLMALIAGAGSPAAAPGLGSTSAAAAPRAPGMAGAAPASTTPAALTSPSPAVATTGGTEPGAGFTVSLSPPSVVAGAPTLVTATITNDAAPLNDEGSSLYILSATVAIGDLADGSANVVSPGVQPGKSVSVGIVVTVPIGGGTLLAVTTDVTPYSSKSDGDGDDSFSPPSRVVYLPVVQPVYTLAFSAGLPGLVQASQPMCPPVGIQLYEGGSPAAVPGIPVEISGVAVAPSTTPPQLTGVTTSVTNSSGLAVFGTCSSGAQIDNIGTFALRAASTSPLVNGDAISTPITVLQAYITCTDNCTVTISSPATGVTSTVNASGRGGFKLGASFGEAASLGCAAQVNPGPWDPVFVTASPGVMGTVTMTFPKTIVNTQSNSGRPHMQVCAQTGTAFRALDGSASTDGLVADCADGTYPYTPSAPYPLGLCVLSRVKGSLGHETVTLLVSDLGDPHYW